MVPTADFVDIHCHLVPEIDDGAKSWDDTLSMASIAVSEGIRTIICTPHQCGVFAHNSGCTIRNRVAEVQDKLTENQIELRVLPGADVRIEAGMVSRIRSGEVLTLADRGRHVLLELPHEMYVPLDHLLAELQAAKLVGILSHPERNAGILANPAVVSSLVDQGCLMQVTAGSLIGAFGPGVQQLSEKLVTQGLTHFVSTDAHGPKSRRPLMKDAFARCVQLVGEPAALAMFSTFPALVADGKDVPRGRVTVVRPTKSRSAFSSWFGMKQSA